MTTDELRTWTAAANEYLQMQLAARAPLALRFEQDFDERPLEGEGRAAVLSFELAPTPGAQSCDAALDPRHYVVVGETTPNYFPAYGLDANDAYSVHLGTRFMLEMGVTRVEPDLEPPTARGMLLQFVRSFAAGATVADDRLAALFRCQDEYFAVYELTIDGEPLYCPGADLPPGFYRLTQHPPQIALRLHLGKLIRAEQESSDQE